MFTQNQEQKQAETRKKARENLTLETTLFTLTKKCFKICAGLDKQFYDQQARSEICYMKSSNPEYEKTMEFFDQCMQRCSYQYAKAYDYVRKQYIQNMNEVQDENDNIYNNYYNESKEQQ